MKCGLTSLPLVAAVLATASAARSLPPSPSRAAFLSPGVGSGRNGFANSAVLSRMARHRALSPRSPGISMGKGDLFTLKERISSVKNTAKLTQAMQAVAAARVRRAQDAVILNRPFNAGIQSMISGMLNYLRKTTQFVDTNEIPLLNTRPDPKTVTLIVVSGDRGLCGSYNSQVIQRAKDRILELENQDFKVRLVTVGLKANSFLRKTEGWERGYECTTSPTAQQAGEIFRSILQDFINFETDRIEIVYTKFINLLKSEPAIRTLVPLTPQGIETEGDEIFTLTTSPTSGKVRVEKRELSPARAADIDNLELLQDPITIINALLPVYAEGQVLRCLQEAVAAELGARMRSMQAATDNAKEVAGTLMIDYQKKRQAVITQEVSEIIGGAEALQAQLTAEAAAGGMTPEGIDLKDALEMFARIQETMDVPPGVEGEAIEGEEEVVDESAEAEEDMRMEMLMGDSLPATFAEEKKLVEV